MDHPGLWNRYQEEATQGWQHHSASEAEQRHSSSSPHQRHPPWSPAAEHEAQLPARAGQALLVRLEEVKNYPELLVGSSCCSSSGDRPYWELCPCL